MDDTTPKVDPVVPAAPSNEPGTTNTPPAVTVSADVEAAKKEAEQAKLRANQLANENKALADKLAAAERTKLEEKEEFKTLYEQTNAKLTEIQSAQAEADRKVELSTATDEVFKDYSANVVDLAKAAGLSLTDDSDTARQSLKQTLDTFKSKVGTPTASPSNPRQTTPEAASRQETMAKIRGGNKDALYAFIQENPGVKRMKEIAQNGA